MAGFGLVMLAVATVLAVVLPAALGPRPTPGTEPNSDRVLVLADGNLTVDLGTVTTDAEGMFSLEITIPAHLPAGTYELQAIGDETLTTRLAVTAVAGGAVGTPTESASETIVARDRGPAGMALYLRVRRNLGPARRPSRMEGRAVPRHGSRPTVNAASCRREVR